MFKVEKATLVSHPGRLKWSGEDEDRDCGKELKDEDGSLLVILLLLSEVQSPGDRKQPCHVFRPHRN